VERMWNKMQIAKIKMLRNTIKNRNSSSSKRFSFEKIRKISIVRIKGRKQISSIIIK
jgi:hypothetical protein